MMDVSASTILPALAIAMCLDKIFTTEAMSAIDSLFHASPESIYWRTRVKREKTEQYEKTGETKQFFSVFEYGLQFKINLTDYLDTGLFLDHRETRRLVASMAAGKRF